MRDRRSDERRVPEGSGRASALNQRFWRSGIRTGSLAFFCYLVVSTLLYAVPVWSRFSEVFAGFGGGDASIYTWSLRWWPYALSHGLDALHPNVIWAPQGISLAWVTSLPGPALIMAPLTNAFGPVVSENLLTVSGPALAGWGAFLLCRKASRGSFLPALGGGYVFGFSTYMTGQLLGHPNLFLVFPVPLAVYLVVRLMEGSLGRIRFVALMALTLLLLFSISTEVFAATAFFAALALAGAWVLSPGARMRAFTAGALILAAYGVTAGVAWPFLHAAITNAPPGALRSVSSGASSVDALSFVIPRWSTFIGGQHFYPTTNLWQAQVSEDGAYLSPALIVVLLVAFVTMILRRDRVLAGSFVFAIVTGIASLGALIHINGSVEMHSLWYPFSKVPVLRDALPQRFTMFMWLGIAVIVARWLSYATTRGGWWRYALVLGVAVLIFPNLWMPGLHTSAAAPTFFQTNAYRDHIVEGSTVLLIHGSKGEEMRWQELTDFWFDMPQGHNGSTPAAFARDPAYRHISHFNPDRLAASELLAFVRAHGVQEVIVGADVAERWRPVVTKALGVEPVRVGGVDVYGPVGGSAGS
jgi:hypothetical protein